MGHDGGVSTGSSARLLNPTAVFLFIYVVSFRSLLVFHQAIFRLNGCRSCLEVLQARTRSPCRAMAQP